MDDDRRWRPDDDIDPDAISIWDRPLTAPSPPQSGVPITEVGRGISQPREERDDSAPLSYEAAIAAGEEWFEDDDEEAATGHTDSASRALQADDLPPDILPGAAPEAPPPASLAMPPPDAPRYRSADHALAAPLPAAAPTPESEPSPLPLAPAPRPRPSAAEPSPLPSERFVPPRTDGVSTIREWQQGDVIADRYRVARKIVSGMGVVYLAFDGLERQPIAIKTYRDLGEEERQTTDGQRRDILLARLFEAEALVWTRLGAHPNIVEARYVVELNGKPHLFLELVGGPDGRGRTLRHVVKAGPTEPARAAFLALQVCAGLEHATSVFPGLVHRDLKPENLLLADGDIVKVTDFGLTRVFADISGRVAALAGTPAYMAPEQCLGLSSLDTRTDIYALGVILFELLTGRRPFTHDVLRAHLAVPPPDPRTLCPAVPAILAEVTLRCLEKRPEERYASIGALRSALEMGYVAMTGQPVALPDQATVARTPTQQAGLDLARAISLTTLGRHEEALELLDRAVQFDPGYAEAWRWRGLGLTALGQHEQAAACLDRAVALAPDDVDAWIERGRLYSRTGQRVEALRCFEQAVEIDATHLAARYERGAAQYFLGRLAEAADDLAWAQARQPGLALDAAMRAIGNQVGRPVGGSTYSAAPGLAALISDQPQRPAEEHRAT